MIVPIIAAIGVLMIIVVISSVKKVSSHEKLVVINSGNVEDVLDSGFKFVNPLSNTRKVDCRKRRVNIPEVGTLSSDDESILMDGFYTIIRVSDVETVLNLDSEVEGRASYEAQNILKEVAKSLSSDTIEAEDIAEIGEKKLKDKEDNLGIEVVSLNSGSVQRK